MLKLFLPFLKGQLADYLDGVISRSKVIPAELKPALSAELHKELGVS